MKNPLNNARILAGAGAAFAAISTACWGYVYGVSESEKDFNDRVEAILRTEIDKVRTAYALRYKDFGPEEYSEIDVVGRPENPVVSAKEIVIPSEAIDTDEGRAAVLAEISRQLAPESVPEPEEVPIESNAFAEARAMQEEALRDARSGDRPYVISKEEFLTNDANFEEYKLTFFEGDGALVGEDDELIPDIDQVIGEENVAHFGLMSGDPNTMYIQNDRSECIFWVTQVYTTVQEFLFGPDASDESIIQHSSMQRRRPRRDND